MKIPLVGIAILLLSAGAAAGGIPRISIPDLLRPETRTKALRDFCETLHRQDPTADEPGNFKVFRIGHSNIMVSRLRRSDGPSRYLVTWQTASSDDWNGLDNTSMKGSLGGQILAPDGLLYYEIFDAQGEPRASPPRIIAQQEPEPFRSKLRELLASELHETRGYLDNTLLTLWQLDLRELKPAIEEIATSGPEDYEGNQGFRSSEKPMRVDQRYHLARKIAALWNENDSLTRAKLLVAFGIGNAAALTWERGDARTYFRAELAASRASLSSREIAEVEEFITWCDANAKTKVKELADLGDVRLILKTCQKIFGSPR